MGLLKKALNAGASSASNHFASQLEENRQMRLQKVRQQGQFAVMEKQDELARARDADAFERDKASGPKFADFYRGEDGSFNQDGEGAYAGQIDTQSGKRVHASTGKSAKPLVQKMTDEMGNDYLAERMPDGTWQRMDIGGGPVPEQVLAEAEQYAEEQIDNRAGWLSGDGSDFKEFGGDREAAREHFRNQFLQQSGHGGGQAAGSIRQPTDPQQGQASTSQPESQQGAANRSTPNPPESLEQGVQMVMDANPGISQEEAAKFVTDRFPQLQPGSQEGEGPKQQEDRPIIKPGEDGFTDQGVVDRFKGVIDSNFGVPARAIADKTTSAGKGLLSAAIGFRDRLAAETAYNKYAHNHRLPDEEIPVEVLQQVLPYISDEQKRAKMAAIIQQKTQGVAQR